ncbi:MAG: hypothetical protein BGN92_13515 [Sphingobacteriales bacterium 41-5]|nr:MAG: hypothetical protein BGN92_13515 [Sphingobacteriales bacterium 41-5]
MIDALLVLTAALGTQEVTILGLLLFVGIIIGVIYAVKNSQNNNVLTNNTVDNLTVPFPQASQNIQLSRDIEKLKDFKKLLDEEIITQEEFDVEKSKILK